MAKISISNLTSGFMSTAALNAAFDLIENELNNKVLYRNNTSGEANQMYQDFDMNGYKIINASDIDVNGVPFLTAMQNIYNDYEALTSRVTVSTASPSGGTDGDIWFKVSY